MLHSHNPRITTKMFLNIFVKDAYEDNSSTRRKLKDQISKTKSSTEQLAGEKSTEKNPAKI